MLYNARYAQNYAGIIGASLVLNKGCNGSNRAAVLSVLVDSWLANPRKDRRSVRVGNLVIASVIAESTWYPFGDSWRPANVTELALFLVEGNATIFASLQKLLHALYV